MSYYNVGRRLRTSIVLVSSSTNDDAVSLNNPVPLNTKTDLIGSAASTISLSSNEITLPSGYWWYVKGSPQVHTNDGWISYKWTDTDTVTKYGRKGFLSMQERAWAFGGDELAICLLDCTTASKTIYLNVEGFTSTTVFNSTDAVQSPNSGKTRVQIWRLG